MSIIHTISVSELKCNNLNLKGNDFVLQHRVSARLVGHTSNVTKPSVGVTPLDVPLTLLRFSGVFSDPAGR